MAVTALALNIFGDGPRLWLSQYNAPNWTTQAKVADSTVDPTILPAVFSAGAVSSAQANNLGIVLWLNDRTSVRFYGSGSITPVDITPPAGFNYWWPHLGNTLTGSFTKTIGAFFRSGIYWLFVLKIAVTGDETWRLVALRSADAGNTWTEEDATNGPLIFDNDNSNSLDGSIQNVYWDGSSANFYVFASVLGSSDIDHAYGQIFKFDASANGGLGLWSTLSDQFLAEGGTRLYGSSHQRNIGGDMAGYAFPLASGDLISIYSTASGNGTFQGGNSNGIYVRKSSGGTWGSATQLRNAPSLLALAVFDPVTETTYVFEYFNGTFGQTPAPPTSFAGGVRVFSVDNTGTASATLFTFPSPVGNASAFGYTDGIDRGVIINGSMYVLYDDWNDISNAVWAWDMSSPLTGTGFVKLNLLPHPSEEPDSGPGFDNPPSCGMLFFAESSTPPPPNPPVPACPISPGASGKVGVPFTATITASGGTPPYTFTIIGGSLPPGLTLDSATGIISGTPTTSGSYPYTVQVTGS